MSTDQILNIPQKIIDVLYEQWGLQDELAREKIEMVGFQYSPGQRFQQGKTIVIEVFRSTGLPTSRTPGTWTIRDLYKLDVWIKLSTTDKDGRQKAENNRATILNNIFRIIHSQQTAVSGLKIASLDKWQNADELEGGTIMLHEVLWVLGQWFHNN